VALLTWHPQADRRAFVVRYLRPALCTPGSVRLLQGGRRPCLHALSPSSQEDAEPPEQPATAAAAPTAAVEQRNPDDRTGLGITWLALIGVADTGYLTAVKLGLVPLICPADGGPLAACSVVLNSSYASVGPVPLAALGLLAYSTVIALNLQKGETARTFLWWLCFGMSLVSLALTAVLYFQLQVACIFCAISAMASAALLALKEVNQRQPVSGEPRRAVFGLSALVFGGGVSATPLLPHDKNLEDDFYSLTEKYKPEHPPLVNHSTDAQKVLARHLAATGAKCYTAWWCPHCQEQRECFGIEAAALAPFVQCSDLKRREMDLCKKVDVAGYPTWIIDGKKYGGGRTLTELAEMTDFKAYPKDVFVRPDRKTLEYIWGKDDDADLLESPN